MRPIYGMKKSHRPPAGFTLLELLLAVSIFSVVCVSLYSSFYVGMRVLRRSQDIMRLNQDLRLVTEGLSLELRNSLPAPIYEEKKDEDLPEDTEGIEEEEEIYYFVGGPKRFSFVTLKDLPSIDANPRREICKVTYYFKSGDGGALARTSQYQSSGFKEAPGGEGEEILLGKVEDMEVTYSYRSEDEHFECRWLDIWDEEERIPLGVKIRLKVKGLGAFRKTVFIPIGALGEEEGQI